MGGVLKRLHFHGLMEWKLMKVETIALCVTHPDEHPHHGIVSTIYVFIRSTNAIDAIPFDTHVIFRGTNVIFFWALTGMVMARILGYALSSGAVESLPKIFSEFSGMQNADYFLERFIRSLSISRILLDAGRFRMGLA